MNRQEAIDVVRLLDAMSTLAANTKIQSTFIKAFKKARLSPKGHHRIHGSINIQGTKSGRPSSSEPNMLNMPSKGIFGEMVKRCFKLPKDLIMLAIDYSGLEDRIITILTNDPNRVIIYADNYDSHSFRAYYYFPERLPNIERTVESINSIPKLFKDVRRDGKPVTFLLAYGGTPYGLQTTCGFPEMVAHKVYGNFLEMNQVTIAWQEDKMYEACDKGYVTLAYGLRLRTPALALCVFGSAYLPQDARQQAKTATNALCQSYSQITGRASIKVFDEINASKYRGRAFQLCDIYDCLILAVPNTVEAIVFFNEMLVRIMTDISEVPELAHDVVKLEAELEVCYPDWSNPIEIPNGATAKEIKKIIKERHK